MNKIYACEDQIEQTKFLLSALKIETAFRTIIRIVSRKHLNHQQTFMHKLKQENTHRALQYYQHVFDQLTQTFFKIRIHKIRSAFYYLLHGGDKDMKKKNEKSVKKLNEEKQIAENKHSSTNQLSIIDNSDDWRVKLSLEELQMNCKYYRMKIDEVENSFSDFFKVIKKE